MSKYVKIKQIVIITSSFSVSHFFSLSAFVWESCQISVEGKMETAVWYGNTQSQNLGFSSLEENLELLLYNERGFRFMKTLSLLRLINKNSMGKDFNTGKLLDQGQELGLSEGIMGSYSSLPGASPDFKTADLERLGGLCVSLLTIWARLSRCRVRVYLLLSALMSCSKDTLLPLPRVSNGN